MQWCSDCVRLHLASKVCHPSFCPLLNGVYPSCLGRSITSPFAVGFAGGKLSRWPFGCSFCPFAGTICCSNSKWVKQTPKVEMQPPPPTPRHVWEDVSLHDVLLYVWRIRVLNNDDHYVKMRQIFKCCAWKFPLSSVSDQKYSAESVFLTFTNGYSFVCEITTLSPVPALRTDFPEIHPS